MSPRAGAARREITNEINLELQERQGDAYLSTATEILYGGAAFGGKSHLMRAAAISWCAAIPGLQVYLFRREFPELYKNHLEGPSSFQEMLAPWVESGFARLVLSKNRIEIGKSRIHLCHCQYENDKTAFQGAEIHVLLVDELTQFTPTIYSYLRGRVRMVGVKPPPEYAGLFPRIIASSNPGGVGHNWVRSAFIDPRPPMEIWRTDLSEGGMRRQFIPARMEDNPIGLEQDPEYPNRLKGLGDPALVAAMEKGDWNIVAGGALDDVWSERCVVPHFSVPKGWRISRAFDWGSSKPYAVTWTATADGNAIDGAPLLPRGSRVVVGELYGWNGKPNEGSRRLAVEVAREILKAEDEMGFKGRVRPGPADSAIFAVENGSSIADEMARVGVTWTPSEKGPGSRKAGLERMRKMLKANKATPREEPCLVVSDNCRHVLRTLPTLPRDPRDPDDVDTKAEDHIYDALRYEITEPSGPRGGATELPW